MDKPLNPLLLRFYWLAILTMITGTTTVILNHQLQADQTQIQTQIQN